MYRIKERYKSHIIKYMMNSGLDINGLYTKEQWNKAGFKDLILEKI